MKNIIKSILIVATISAQASLFAAYVLGEAILAYPIQEGSIFYVVVSCNSRHCCCGRYVTSKQINDEVELRQAIAQYMAMFVSREFFDTCMIHFYPNTPHGPKLFFDR